MAEFQEPNPGQSQTSADAYVGQLIQQAMLNRPGATTGEDAPIIPLWRVRPAFQRQGGAGSAASADRSYSVSGAGSASSADRFIMDHPPGVGPTPPQYQSVNFAEAYWLDMPEEDRKAFMESAQREGFWKPSQGADGLVSAWGKAVALAAQYNANHDKGKWISPFEAIEKMAVASMAGENQSHDAFSTETSYRKFSQNELLGNARSVLQQELGRNPTGSEMKAFTAAVNAASAQHPQTVTRQTTQNADGSVSSAVTNVEGGNFDPNAVIEDQVTGTKEHADVQAAMTYFPALMQALGAVV